MVAPTIANKWESYFFRPGNIGNRWENSSWYPVHIQDTVRLPKDDDPELKGGMQEKKPYLI